MQIGSRLGNEPSYARVAVPVAALDAVDAARNAANDASALPFPADAVCMRDPYFTYELI